MDNAKYLSAIDSEHHKLIQIVNSLYHYVLHDYIADANRNQVLDNLYKFFKEGDIEIISKAQLKVYQELEKLTLPNNALKINKE